ncbi:universal stress protein UspA [Halobacteriales archaeon QS_1_68_20]|nr:MAG: universal stress protein UspA [Halobacteriales archaeon QS_1_68_20]
MVVVSDLLGDVVIPVANEDVAEETAALAREHLDDDSNVTVVHVVADEQAFDESSEEEWESFAEDAFERFEATYGGAVETEVRYGTDVVEGIFAAADDVGASAIVFKPRGGSRWRQLMSGDVARELVAECDRPVVALPGDS